MTWTAPNNGGAPITDYDVRYSKQGEEAWTEHDFSGPGTHHYDLEAWNPDTPYEVQVQATNAEGPSGWSASGTGRTTDSTTPPPEPNQPPAFTETNPQRSIAENAPAGTPVGAPLTATDPDGDPIIYSMSESDEFDIDSTTGQLKVADGAALNYEGTTDYRVTVGANDGRNVITQVEVTITVTDVDEPPAAPAAPEVTASNGAPAETTPRPGTAASTVPQTDLDVTWSEPDNTGPPINGYEVQYQQQGETTWTAHSHSGTTTTTTIPGLLAGTTYKVRVRATNAEGTSGWSAAGTGRTLTNIVLNVPEPPGKPNAPTVAASATTPQTALDVTWTAPANTGPSITDYDVRYSKQGTSAWTAHDFSGPGTTTTIEGLDPDTPYKVQVRATNAEGTSGWSASGTGRTLANIVLNVPEPPGKPNAPTVAASATTPQTALDVTWTAPTNTGPSITDYDVRYSKQGEEAWTAHDFSGPGTTTTIGGLDPGTPYKVQVRATNADGLGEWSASGTGRTLANIVLNVPEPPGKPNAPTVAASATTPQTALDVTWTAPANTGPPITDYDVRYSKQGEEAWTAHDFSGPGTTTTIGGLDPGTTYEVQVRATNADGTSGWSAAGTGTTQAEETTPPVSDPPASTEVGDPITLPDTQTPGEPEEVEPPPNEIPVFAAESAEWSVAENAPVGTPVGTPILATDPDGDLPIVYVLPYSDAFAINRHTGQIEVENPLDYETAATHALTLQAYDRRGGIGRLAVTITVTDVEEPPAAPAAPVVSTVSESSLQVSWVAPATAAALPLTDYDVQYRRTDTGMGTFTEVPHDGTATQLLLKGLDANTVYQVRVCATNAEGRSEWSEPSTGYTGENSPPFFPDPANPTQALQTTQRSIAENAPVGTPVGAPLGATDPDGDSLLYLIDAIGTYGAGAPATGGTLADVLWRANTFALHPRTGQLTVGMALDYETQTTHVLTIEVRDGRGGRSRLSVTIEVTDVDESVAAKPVPSIGLLPNAPNPFNSSTQLAYRLAVPGRVQLVLYNSLGQRVRTLVDQFRAVGSYHVAWDARDQRGQPVATGVYIVRLSHPGGVQTQRLLFLK